MESRMPTDLPPSTFSRPFPRLRWLVWIVALAIYTYLLVVPNDWLPAWLQTTTGTKITDEFTVGKMAHALNYAAFTLAALALPISWRGWFLCVAVLSLHGFGTEYVQTYTGR